MGVRDKTCNSTEDSEWFDLQMGCGGYDVPLVKGYVRIVLLVDVEVFNETPS